MFSSVETVSWKVLVVDVEKKFEEKCRKETLLSLRARALAFQPPRLDLTSLPYQQTFAESINGNDSRSIVVSHVVLQLKQSVQWHANGPTLWAQLNSRAASACPSYEPIANSIFHDSPSCWPAYQTACEEVIIMQALRTSLSWSRAA